MISAAQAGDVPPVYTIDLSLPPAQRYAHVARIYRDELRSITGLFDELVLETLPEKCLPWIKTLARLFLRRLYSNEETEEIRGMSKVTGIDMYLIVSLNVLLDLLMGCTSGAALSKERQAPPNEQARLLHFRTLDWGMPALRKLLVRLDYVRSAEGPAVIATNITYVGFVGVLTGVREGLSISLNFRPNHDGSSLLRHVRYYGSHLLVLLGLRRSISSLLRQLVIPSKPKKRSWLSRLSSAWLPKVKTRLLHQLYLPEAVSMILRTPSTACYLVLCDGSQVYMMEKDLRTSTVESHSSFLVATNHDRGAQVAQTGRYAQKEHHGASLSTDQPIFLADFLKDSIERRECVQAHWDMKVAQARQAARLRAASKSNTSPHARKDSLRRTCSFQRQETAAPLPIETAITSSKRVLPDPEVTATLDEIVKWTTMYPTTNEMTHFSIVMDPTKGEVTWIRRYPEPLECDWEIDDFD